MPATFSLDYAPGFVLYSLAFDTLGGAWDGSSFVDPTGIRPSLAGPMTWDGTRYVGDVPTSLPVGQWQFNAYLQRDIEPQDADPAVGTAFVTYGGDPLQVASGFRAALMARLSSDVLLADLVGTQIYPQKIPQRGATPAVVWTLSGVERDHDLDGPTGLATATVGLEAVDEDALITDRVATRLREIFDGFKGTLGGLVDVVSTTHEDEGDDYNEPVDASEDGMFRVALNYTFMFHEAPANRTE
jgi:hypothetical protein